MGFSWRLECIMLARANQASSGKKPGTPTIGTATAGNAQATVAFTVPSYTGKGGTVTYVATSSPGSITGSSTSSPITVTGLTNGTAYTFTVRAQTSYGVNSDNSASSNSVTPVVPGVTADWYLISGGGGGGSVTGSQVASGGGAGGGIKTGTSTFNYGTTYTVTVGGGGAGGTVVTQQAAIALGGSQGGQSKITGTGFSQSATGGGGGQGGGSQNSGPGPGGGAGGTSSVAGTYTYNDVNGGIQFSGGWAIKGYGTAGGGGSGAGSAGGNATTNNTYDIAGARGNALFNQTWYNSFSAMPVVSRGAIGGGSLQGAAPSAQTYPNGTLSAPNTNNSNITNAGFAGGGTWSNGINYSGQSGNAGAVAISFSSTLTPASVTGSPAIFTDVSGRKTYVWLGNGSFTF